MSRRKVMRNLVGPFSTMMSRAINYNPVGRKLIFVQPLPQGALAHYIRERYQIEEGALVVTNRKRVKHGLRTIVPRHTVNP